MAKTTSTVLGPDGAPVVVHVAEPGPDADGLRHEAAVLEQVRGPGVVELVGASDTTDGGARLATRYLPGGTLAHLARTDGEAAALVALAQVARTLDRIHGLGVVHGRCTADHVVGDLRATALCGFGAARLAPTDGALDPAPDVGAFAALVEAVLPPGGAGVEAARLAAAGLVAGRADLLATATALEALAAQGAAPPRDGPRLLRPRHARPTAAGEVGGGDAAAAPAPREGRRRRVAAGAVAVALVVGLGAAAAGGGGAGVGADRGWETPAASGDRPAGTTSSTGPDPPGDGAAPGSGATPVVDHDGARWAVGAPGDLVAVGDWDCDGLATPAVVRPADGVVWAFPSWEGAGAVALGYVAGPVRAEAVPAAGGCDLLAVTTADGREVVVGG